MALTQVNGGMLDSVAQQVGFRNRIINGAMMIDQRNAGTAITASTGGVSNFAVDRFIYAQGTGNAPTLQRTTTAPAGFVNSLVVTAGTASTPSYSQLAQRIEGLNMADMGYGSANAQTMTLSFWVRSSVTGTFSVSVRNSAANRSYIATYSINAANTWEYKTITITGDTSGTWLTDTGVWAYLVWDLVGGGSGTAGSWTASGNTSTSGSTGIMGTTGATFYITGVQLEKGSTATSFDYRPYGTELALCQRYCYALFATDCASDNFARFALGDCDLTTRLQGYVWFPVNMRSAPSLTATAANTFGLYSAGTVNTCTNVYIAPTVTAKIGVTQLDTSATLTVGRAGQILANNNRTAYLIYSAEL